MTNALKELYQGSYDFESSIKTLIALLRSFVEDHTEEHYVITQERIDVFSDTLNRVREDVAAYDSKTVFPLVSLIDNILEMLPDWQSSKDNSDKLLRTIHAAKLEVFTITQVSDDSVFHFNSNGWYKVYHNECLSFYSDVSVYGIRNFGDSPEKIATISEIFDSCIPKITVTYFDLGSVTNPDVTVVVNYLLQRSVNKLKIS